MRQARSKLIGNNTDVSNAAPNVGDVLKWSGTEWVPSESDGVPEIPPEYNPDSFYSLDGVSEYLRFTGTQIMHPGVSWTVGLKLRSGYGVDSTGMSCKMSSDGQSVSFMSADMMIDSASSGRGRLSYESTAGQVLHLLSSKVKPYTTAVSSPITAGDWVFLGYDHATTTFSHAIGSPNGTRFARFYSGNAGASWQPTVDATNSTPDDFLVGAVRGPGGMSYTANGISLVVASDTMLLGDADTQELMTTDDITGSSAYSNLTLFADIGPSGVTLIKGSGTAEVVS